MALRLAASQVRATMIFLPRAMLFLFLLLHPSVTWANQDEVAPRDMRSRLDAPRISLRSPPSFAIPGTRVVVVLSVEGNSVARELHENKVKILYQIVALTDQSVARAVCADPEGLWPELSRELSAYEAARATGRPVSSPLTQGLSPLDPRQARLVTLTSRNSIAQYELGFVAESHEIDYLVYASIVTGDVSEHEAKSESAFTCIKVRMPRYWIGIGLGTTVLSNDTRHGTVFGSISPSDVRYPAAAMHPGLAISLRFLRTFASRRHRTIPFLRLGPVAGFYYQSGIYPCGSLRAESCISFGSLYPRHTSSIFAGDLRIALDWDFVRLRRFGVGLLAEAGLSVTLLRSKPAFERDGTYATAVTTLGATFNLFAAGRQGRVMTRTAFIVAWAMKAGFRDRAIIQNTFTDGPGVPSAVSSLLLSIHTDFGLRSLH